MSRFMLVGLLLAAGLPAQAPDCPPPPYVARLWIDAGGAVGENVEFAFGRLGVGNPYVLVASPYANMVPYFPVASGTAPSSGYVRVRRFIPPVAGLIGQTLHLVVYEVVQGWPTASYLLEWHIAPNLPTAFVKSYNVPQIPVGSRASRTGLQDGTFLYTGGWMGWCPPAVRTNQAAVLEPMKGVILSTPKMTTLRAAHASVALGNGTALVIGGDDAATPPTAELYDPKSGRFTNLGTVPFRFTDPIAKSIRDPVTRKEFVLVAGGTDSLFNAVDKAVLYDVQTRKFTALPSMKRPRADAASATLPIGAILISGGQNGQSGVLNDFEVFVLATRSFYSLGRLQVPRSSHAMVPLGPTAALVIGGVGAAWNNVIRDLEIFDGVSLQSYRLPFRLHKGRIDVEPAWLKDGSLLVCDDQTPERITPSGSVLLRPLQDPVPGPAFYGLPGPVHPLSGSGAVAFGEFFGHLVK